MARVEDFDFEAGWERREAFRTFDRDVLAELLRPIVPPESITGLEPLSGGKANTNYRVRLRHPGASFVLRIYTRDAATCAREVALHDLLRGRVAVAKVLYSQTRPGDFEHPYAAFSWIDGDPLAEAFASAVDQRELGIALGDTLAAIQGLRFDAPGAFGPDLSIARAQPAYLPYIEECLSDTATAISREVAAGIRALIARNAHLLPGEHEPAVLVHGDYKAGNILVRPTVSGWQVAGVLDWEFAFAGPALFDLAPLLRYSHRLAPELEEGVVEGMRRADTPLPRDWKRRVRLIDLLNLCDFARQPNRGEKLARDVNDLLARTLADWDGYA